MGTPIDQLIKNRKEKLAKIIKLGFNPSPPFYKKEQQIKNVKKIGLKANIAGRIIAYRRHGKLCFLDLKDETGKIQALTTANDLGEKTYAMIKLLDVGDFIGVQGEVFKTQAGEITIKAKAATFLQKGLHPLPDTWYGLKDT
ncbi:MAG: OB-fold nucleic acid binding domain-containing protein, partial [Patescibacteria group bacterium]|nr:OB-fold nucleic acid binding domain-containing protein [Patescibacteria group bacterium]